MPENYYGFTPYTPRITPEDPFLSGIRTVLPQLQAAAQQYYAQQQKTAEEARLRKMQADEFAAVSQSPLVQAMLGELSGEAPAMAPAGPSAPRDMTGATLGAAGQMGSALGLPAASRFNMGPVGPMAPPAVPAARAIGASPALESSLVGSQSLAPKSEMRAPAPTKAPASRVPRTKAEFDAIMKLAPHVTQLRATREAAAGRAQAAEKTAASRQQMAEQRNAIKLLQIAERSAQEAQNRLARIRVAGMRPGGKIDRTAFNELAKLKREAETAYNAAANAVVKAQGNMMDPEDPLFKELEGQRQIALRRMQSLQQELSAFQSMNPAPPPSTGSTRPTPVKVEPVGPQKSITRESLRNMSPAEFEALKKSRGL